MDGITHRSAGSRAADNRPVGVMSKVTQDMGLDGLAQLLMVGIDSFTTTVLLGVAIAADAVESA